MRRRLEVEINLVPDLRLSTARHVAVKVAVESVEAGRTKSLSLSSEFRCCQDRGAHRTDVLARAIR